MPNKNILSSSTFSRGCRGAAAAVLAIALISGSAVASVAATPMATPERSVLAAESLREIPRWTGAPSLVEIKGGIGGMLTAYFQIWEVDDVVETFQWYRDGKKIEGDTGRSHTFVAADKGKKLHAVMTGSKPGYAPTRVTTEKQAFDFKLTFSGQPNIMNPWGSPMLGFPIFAGADYAKTPRLGIGIVEKFAYQWNRDGQAIKGARSSSYDVTAQDVGKKLSVTVTPIVNGYTSNSSTSEATAPAIDPRVINKVKPKVTGTAKAGQKLSATTGKWNTNAKTFSYQWYADGVAIPGATASSYSIAKSLTGKKVAVKVTAKGTYQTETVSSAPTAVVRRF